MTKDETSLRFVAASGLEIGYAMHPMEFEALHRVAVRKPSGASSDETSPEIGARSMIRWDDSTSSRRSFPLTCRPI